MNEGGELGVAPQDFDQMTAPHSPLDAGCYFVAGSQAHAAYFDVREDGRVVPLSAEEGERRALAGGNSSDTR